MKQVSPAIAAQIKAAQKKLRKATVQPGEAPLAPKLIPAELQPRVDAKGRMVYPFGGMGKPRQTQKDKWKWRKEVAAYRRWKDMIRLSGFTLPTHGYHLIFVIAIPPSIRPAERAERLGREHLLKPDKDNLEKAVLDALHIEDSHVWDGRASKIWGNRGLIVVDQAPPYEPETIEFPGE